jgi:ABC-2 type transport system permease protein
MNTSVSEQFQYVGEKGWRRGLGNLLNGEYSAWFKSSRWWKHLIMWVVIVNAMMAIMIIATVEAAKEGSEGPPILFMYAIFGVMFVSLGVMIIMQQVLVREKNSGTAAWVLSKPVTRSAFVISRLVVNTFAILITSVIVPGVILYFTLGFFSDLGWLSPLGFTASILIVSTYIFYWIALVLMMGTLVDSASIVIAVPMALFFLFWMGPDLLPQINYISPFPLIYTSSPEQMNSISGALMAGEPVSWWLPLVVTVVSSLIFVAVALWRFNRQEF